MTRFRENRRCEDRNIHGTAIPAGELISGRAIDHFRLSSSGTQSSWPSTEVRWTGRAKDPSLIFDSARLDPRDRFDAFHEFWSDMYEVAPPDFPVADFRSEVRLWRLGAVTMTRLLLPPNKSFRSPTRSRGFEGDVLVLRIVTRGRLRMVLDGQMVELAPGTAYLCDEMRSCGHITGPDFAFSCITIPYDAIGYDPYRHPPVTAIPLGAPVGRLLLAVVDALYREVTSGEDVDGDKLSKALLGFLRTLTIESFDIVPGEPAVEEFRAAAMRRYLDEHLLDEKLDAETIGRALGASRASVYRAFEVEGGVRTAIRKRRLRAALMDLVEHGTMYGAVGAAAARWHMYDANRFSRMCREEFGYSPSAVLSFMNPGEGSLGPCPGAASAVSGSSAFTRST